MSKKLRIAVYPADEGGCGHYRMWWPAKAVKDNFSDKVELLLGNDAPQIKVRWNQEWKHEYENVPPWVQAIDAWTEEQVDIAVFQRPSGHEMPNALRALRERGITIIVDLDDNFDRIDPRNFAWFASEPYWHTQERIDQYVKKYGKVTISKASFNEEHFYVPEYEGRYSRRFIHKSLNSATMLTTSTQHIADHYKNSVKTTRVIENHVPEHYLNIKREIENEKINVGWTGTLATHPYDFVPVGSAIKQARQKTDFWWRIIGDGIGITEKTGLMPDDFSDWVPLSEYPMYYKQLDVVVCPLDDQQFNYSKSWLKPLEAAALGVVPIMSPLPEYVKIHDKGVGVIAKRPRDWEKHIVRLVNDNDYRNELAEQGKEFASTMTYEGNAHKWLNTWIEAYEMNRR